MTSRPLSEYFERAAAKNPSEWVKAAEARLMLGDRAGADALFAKSGAAGYQMAQWNFLTGRRTLGSAKWRGWLKWRNWRPRRMAICRRSRSVSLRSGSWKWATARRQRTWRMKLPCAPAVHRHIAIAGLCLHITSGGARRRLRAAVREKVPRGDPVVAGWVSGNQSVRGWQLRTLLAWAYVETGAIDQAASLLDPYPLPLSSGEPLFASLIFPRYLSLRGTVLRHQGKIDEAKQSFELYSKYQDQPESNATK